MTEQLIFFIEMIGTVAFAISGAMVGLKREMDIFGVTILGLVTSVGGGMIRDLVLGQTPPMMFRNPIYALAAVIVSVVVFLPFVRGFFRRFQYVYDHLLLIMDSLGLGIFTVVGVRTAYESGHGGFFLLLFVGVITGVGGGLLRDVMAGQTPYIFVKHIYACASLAGAAACIFLWNLLPGIWAMLVGAVIVILLRLLAAHFRWNLPKASV
ncbi:MAG: TRIC cation channel family protein [Clostridia bacterium]|nr:TRIC cation channel family protein [Clostridia bacterium]MBQ5743181.1 TRIC cation channel family protein [Clostridia bacterium]